MDIFVKHLYTIVEKRCRPLATIAVSVTWLLKRDSFKDRDYNLKNMVDLIGGEIIFYRDTYVHLPNGQPGPQPDCLDIGVCDITLVPHNQTLVTPQYTVSIAEAPNLPGVFPTDAETRSLVEKYAENLGLEWRKGDEMYGPRRPEMPVIKLLGLAFVPWNSVLV